MVKDNRNIKILILSHISELRGGAERSILEVLDILVERHSIEPEFILRNPLRGYEQALTERGWKYHALNYTFWSEAKISKDPADVYQRQLINSKAILEIEELIEEIKPDVVLTNSVVCPWAALAAHFQQIPHVWFVREYGDLDHGREFELGRQKTLTDVGNLSELVLTNSKALAKHLKQYINKDKVTTLYHPFNLKKLEKLSQKKAPNPFSDKESLKLVMTGSIAKTKGQLEVINAVGRLNKDGYNTELCLIGPEGEPELMEDIKTSINEYDIANKVHLLGGVENGKVLAYVRHADVGVMSSKSEAFGRVTFEYLACGKPVVGTNTGATPEMVENGVNGYLYEYKDTDSLVNSLGNYFQDKTLIEDQGEQSKLKATHMLNDRNNIDEAYKRMEHVADGGKDPISNPINILHRWVEYSQITEERIASERAATLKILLKKSIRFRLKKIYHRLPRRAREAADKARKKV